VQKYKNVGYRLQVSDPRFQMSVTGTMSLPETDLIFGSYSQNDFVIYDLINSEREVVQKSSILARTT